MNLNAEFLVIVKSYAEKMEATFVFIHCKNGCVLVKKSFPILGRGRKANVPFAQ